MRYLFNFGLLLGFLVPFTAVAQTTGLPAGYEPLDRVRAIVDSKVVTQYELERAFQPLAGLGFGILDSQEREKWFADKREEVLTEQINTLLILAEARSLNIEASPQQVAAHVNGLKAQAGYSDAQLIQFVRRIGFRDVAHYREHVERELIKAQTVSRRLSSRIRPSRDDVQRVFLRDYYGGQEMDEVHAQHILLRLPNLATPVQIQELSARAHQVRSMALAEEKTFEQLAIEYSQDSNANRGGDLGRFTRCTLDPEFERAVFSLEAGQISEVVRTGFGFHVIRVVERRRIPMRNEARVKRCIRMDIEMGNRVTAYEAYTGELRLSHHVRILP